MWWSWCFPACRSWRLHAIRLVVASHWAATGCFAVPRQSRSHRPRRPGSQPKLQLRRPSVEILYVGEPESRGYPDCGIFNFRTCEPVARDVLKLAADAMAHRGPDDEGFHLDAELGLGNRRLSIIDLPGGHQPLSNEDGTIWITFNGEIYNYRELRVGLESRGHRFHTSTDTEAIVHLYEDYEFGWLDHLRGMFAFALWDRRRRRLLLARDRLGIKPLFYRLEPDRLMFASELRALRQLSTAAFEVDPQSVYDFFGFRYIPAPRTFYRGVEKLLPGHLMVADAKGARTSAYWDIPGEEDASRGAGEWAEAVMELLCESVQLRLIADVPLGVFLSGGTDSSALVA